MEWMGATKKTKKKPRRKHQVLWCRRHCAIRLPHTHTKNVCTNQVDPTYVCVGKDGSVCAYLCFFFRALAFFVLYFYSVFLDAFLYFLVRSRPRAMQLSFPDERMYVCSSNQAQQQRLLVLLLLLLLLLPSRRTLHNTTARQVLGCEPKLRSCGCAKAYYNKRRVWGCNPTQAHKQQHTEAQAHTAQDTRHYCPTPHTRRTTDAYLPSR